MRASHATFPAALAILISAAVSAAAAELPSRRAAEKQAVKSCASYGEGFVWAPSVNSCVKVGGFVRVETGIVPRAAAR